MSPKITSVQLNRKAYVYVRQSTPTQILLHHESTERQYQLRQRAIDLGWAPTQVEVIDEDQGRSGQTAAHRSGFQRLIAEVGLGQVGVVLMLEASRLARNNGDWYQLIEICAVSRTLIADEQAVYDPRDPNDRLLLGVKGTLSEAELFTLRTRLYEGRWNKARKGTLLFPLPVGYVRGSDGGWELDPDQLVRERLRYVFEAFRRCGVARSVVVDLKQQGWELPAHVAKRENYGALVWKAPTLSAVIRILSNPAYAGAYVYGRWEYSGETRSPTTGKARPHLRCAADWPVCIHNHHDAYLSWEEYVHNRAQLRHNWYREGQRGAAREGTALLQGIVACGICGRKMSVQHHAARERRAPTYLCAQGYHDGERHICQSMTAQPVDAAVVAAFLDAVAPLQLAVAVQVLDQIEGQIAVEQRQWELQVEQARYAARLAQRQYEAVDPENRLVARELERRWNDQLERVAQVERAYTQAAQQAHWQLSPEERVALRDLAQNLPAIWAAASTTNRERKQLLRSAITTVQLDGQREAGQIEVQIHWRSGTITRLMLVRPAPGAGSLKTPAAAVELIHQLAPTQTYTEIAEQLNAAGWRSAFGRPFTAQHVGYVCRRDGLGKGQGRSSRPGVAALGRSGHHVTEGRGAALG
jgi:DNA invertase Pin-like site-specific DNA recombinase